MKDVASERLVPKTTSTKIKGERWFFFHGQIFDSYEISRLMLEQVMLKFKNSPICTQFPALMPKNSKQIALLNLCFSQLLWCDPMCFLLLDIAKTEDVATIFALRVVHCGRGKVHKLD